MTCPHGDDVPQACIDCLMENPPKGPIRRLGASGDGSVSVEASFDSRCPGCGDAINAGDRIFLLEGQWVGRCCT